MRLLSLFLAISCSQAGAAGVNVEAFDPGRCQSWWVTDELGFNLEPLSEPLKEALSQARNAPNAELTGKGITLRGFIRQMSRGSRFPGEDVGDVVCLANQRLTCFTQQSHEVRQFEFIITSPPDSKRPPTYSCKSKCGKQSVTSAFQLPWEDGPKNLDYNRAYKRFAQRCG